MTYILFALFLALGIGTEHMRIRFLLWRKRQRRFGSFRKEPEPVWADLDRQERSAT